MIDWESEPWSGGVYHVAKRHLEHREEGLGRERGGDLIER